VLQQHVARRLPLNRLHVPLVASSQGIDTSNDNPAGRLQLGVLMAVAEFERGIIRERVNAGLAAAKARGVRLGRPATISARTEEVEKLKAHGMGIRAIARKLKMPVSSVYKAVKISHEAVKFGSARLRPENFVHIDDHPFVIVDMCRVGGEAAWLVSGRRNRAGRRANRKRPRRTNPGTLNGRSPQAPLFCLCAPWLKRESVPRPPRAATNTHPNFAIVTLTCRRPRGKMRPSHH